MKIWIGRVVSAIPVLLLALSAVMKLLHNPQAVEGFEKHFGWPVALLTPIGVIELLCVVIYLVPQTAVLGAILVTGYCGGAIATEVRIGSPNWIGPLIGGVLVWLGLWLRDARVREQLPLRR